MTELDKIEKRLKIGTRLVDSKDPTEPVEISGPRQRYSRDDAYKTSSPNGREGEIFLPHREGEVRLEGDDIVLYNSKNEEWARATIIPNRETER